MTIIYRLEKGAPLTAAEIDGNFQELDNRLNDLEAHHEVGESLGKIHIEGDQICFTGTFGTDFGTFTLPKARLNPCGLWVTQTSYKKLDLVTYERALYCCLKEHISAHWEQDRSFWKHAFDLSPPPSPSLPVYEKASLPVEEKMGQLALLWEDKSPTLIFFDGSHWQCLNKGETL